MFFFGSDKTAGEAPTVIVMNIYLLLQYANTSLFLWYYLHSSELFMFYVPLGMRCILSSWIKIMIFAVFIFAFILLISLSFKFSECVILTKLKVSSKDNLFY